MATAMRHKKLKQALFDVVNDVAERMDCSRVIIGITNHDAIELSATSHATWFEKNTRLAQLYTVAMEETRDRLETIVVPQPEGMSVPALAHSELAAATEAGALICCPLRKGADCIGVILLERGEGEAFSDGDIEWVETLATMLPNVIDLRRRSERGFLGYLGNDLRALATRFFGPGHLTWKAIGLLVIVGIAILTFVHSDYRVAAKTVIEGEIQRAAVAPFEGFIGQSFVRAGDTVKTGQVLCALDDKDLKLERTRWASERDQHLQKYREALATRDLPATQVLQAQIKQAEAQLALVEQKLSRTKITAPFDGIVVSGDLTQMIGAPVETGKKLFEVAPLDRYRVILKVDEREIRYVELGQHGKLMMSGVAGEAMPFSVKKITPVATAESGQNFFRVEAQLANVNISMRPGMEGVGKISIGEQPLWWIMTRSFGDWLRLALWNWMP